jgi:hypothetical protein
METGRMETGRMETGLTSCDGENERAEQSPRVLAHQLLSASVIVERHARAHEPSARSALFTCFECWLWGRTLVAISFSFASSPVGRPHQRSTQRHPLRRQQRDAL